MLLLPRFPENAGTKVQMTIFKWFHIHDVVLHKNGYIGQTAMCIYFFHMNDVRILNAYGLFSFQELRR